MSTDLSSNELVSFYSSVLPQLPEKFKDFLKSNSGYFTKLAEALQSNPDFFVERYQSVVQDETRVFTLGELMANAPLQMQRGIDPGRVSDMWMNGNTGLMKLGVLLYRPEVAFYSDGSMLVVGGNNRIGSIVSPAVSAGIDEDALMEIKVECTVKTINRDAIADLLESSGVDATDEAIDKTHDELVFSLWIASNGSRKMTASEIKDADSYRLNVDRNDEESVIEAHFGKRKKIDFAQAFRFLTVIYLNQSNDLEPVADEDSGADKLDVMLPIGNEPSVVRVNTLDAIIKSFVSQLSKIHAPVEYVKRTTKEVSTKNVKYWTDDMKDAESTLRIVEAITEGAYPLICRAIDNTLGELPSDSEFKGNVARNAPKIGLALANLFDGAFDPVNDPRVPKEVAPKKAKKPAVSGGLGLAL